MTIEKIPGNCSGFYIAEKKATNELRGKQAGASCTKNCTDCGLPVTVKSTTYGVNTTFNYEEFDRKCTN